jgi:hypothetical protein
MRHATIEHASLVADDQEKRPVGFRRRSFLIFHSTANAIIYCFDRTMTANRKRQTVRCNWLERMCLFGVELLDGWRYDIKPSVINRSASAQAPAHSDYLFLFPTSLAHLSNASTWCILLYAYRTQFERRYRRQPKGVNHRVVNRR